MSDTTSPIELALTFDSSLKEHVLACRAVTRLQQSVRMMLYLFYGMLAVAIVLVAVTGGCILYSSSPAFWLFVVVPGVGLASLYWTPRAAARNVYRGSGPYAYTLGPHGLKLVAPGATSELKWEAILKGVETRDFLLLYLSRGYAVFIPKRIFDSAALEHARNCLRAYLGVRAGVRDTGSR